MSEYLDSHAEAYSRLDEATARMVAFLLNLDLSDEEEMQLKEGGLDMCKALEDMKKEAEEKGMLAGEIRGKEKIILSMLGKGMSCEEVSFLTDVPLERVTQIAAME